MIPLHDDKPMHPWLPVKHVGSGEKGEKKGRKKLADRTTGKKLRRGGEEEGEARRGNW